MNTRSTPQADRQSYLNTAAAFEAGRRVGAKEERERLADSKATAGDREGGEPGRLTLDAIRAGQVSTEELIARKDEVDALLQGGGA